MTRWSVLLVLTVGTLAHAQDRPLPPKEAPKAMTLPAGFKATLFAGEPDVVQPIAFTFDDRGRLWVIECLSYPKWRDDRKGSDRVIIFEDTDGDGCFDKKTVFLDNGANLSGIELGFGGVWLCSTPDLLFVPTDINADAPRPGKPRILLDGWSLQAKHNVFNSLTWGPDGWLYGCNGILATSLIGKPGTAAKDRVPMNCGVWRYHPTRQVFEVFAHGTTNPWGLDFNDEGEMFITNCVIKHIFHVVPGAHFERMYGQDLNPYVYKLMPSIADHLHWGGGDWTSSHGGKGVHDAPGGGHAHSGCMVYLGDNWPDEYRNNAFMCNIHGNRINRDTLHPRGSTYVAKHAPDVMLANDPWFRGLALKYGPDGGVFVSDWTDTGECHNYEKADQTNGRVFKITYGRPKAWHGNLSKLSDVELVKLQAHKNDWFVQHARRLLHERAAAGKFDPAALEELKFGELMAEKTPQRLRFLWARSITTTPTQKQWRDYLRSSDERVRAWAVRLLADSKALPGEFLGTLCSLAEHDPSPAVRLALTVPLRRLSAAEAIIVLRRLVKHESDRHDDYLALMYWYGVDKAFPASADLHFDLLSASRIPLLQEYLTRRLLSARASPNDEAKRLAGFMTWLACEPNIAKRESVLKGMRDALAGRLFPAPPDGWQTVLNLARASSVEAKEVAFTLCVIFNDGAATNQLMDLLKQPSFPPITYERQAALRAMLLRPNSHLYDAILRLIDDDELQTDAIRALASFDRANTATMIIGKYQRFTATAKSDAIQTLASRPSYALALLNAVEKGTVPRADISPVIARQLLSLKNAEVAAKLEKVWGTIRPAAKERAALTEKYKAFLADDALKAADPRKGRTIFANTCGSCHKLFGEGASIGPELTGSQRTNLDYILENVLDPSAVVPREYQVVVFELKSGRVLNGIVAEETERAVTVQTQNERIVVPKDEIEARTQTNASMMPEGLLDKLTTEEVRNLVSYLMTKRH